MAKIKQLTTQDILAPLGEAVRKYLFDEKKNIADVAVAAGVSEPTLSNLKNGNSGNITFSKLVNISNAIGVSITLDIRPIKK